LDDLVRIVDLWDPLKQRTAVASFVYYARHIEKNSSLSERLAEFLSTASEEIGSPDSSQEEYSSPSTGTGKTGKK
jgi:hypothetical protein